MEWKVPLFRIYYGDDDVEAVASAVMAGMYWAVGPKVKELEGNLCEKFGVKHALVFNSGTSALHALLAAHGLGKGDEVVVPSFTFIATANSPLFVGARPVFADIEDETYALDPDDVRRRITRRTKAIMPVHYGGIPAKGVRELRDLAEEKGLLLIEDNAESIGAKVRGKYAGTFGDSAIWSFCQTKVITTGEGGALTTDDTDVYEKAKLVRSHGRAETADYFSSTDYMDYVQLGFNFRMPNLLAALGVTQLAKLDEIIVKRNRVARKLDKALSGVSEVSPLTAPKGFTHVYQMYTVRVAGGRKVRDALKRHLESRGVMSRVYFDPVHKTGFYKSRGDAKTRLPVTERVSGEVLTLPMFTHMSDAEIGIVTDAVEEFFAKPAKRPRRR